MLSTFWCSQGVILSDFLQKEATIASTYYVNLIVKLSEVIKENVVNSCTKLAIAKGGCKLIEYSPHFPEIAPSNCFQN